MTTSVCNFSKGLVITFLLFILQSCLDKELIEEYLISVDIKNNQKPIERMKFYFTEYDIETKKEYLTNDTIFINRKTEIGQGYDFRYNYSNVDSFYSSIDISKRLNIEIYVPGEAMRKETVSITGRGVTKNLIVN